MQDAVVDYVRYWTERTGISYRRIVQWIGIPRSKFYQWQQRYGKVNDHNGWVPRDFWLRNWEKQAILDFWSMHSREGYRRMTYMMLDAAKVEAIRPKTPLSVEDARRIVTEYVEHYNTVRLHSALGYITPQDQLEGRAEQIFAAREAKLERAREARRNAAATPAPEGESTSVQSEGSYEGRQP